MSDEINHPSHYNQGKIEVYDFIVDQNLSFAEGNVVKYVCRSKHKGERLKDLRKAEWYLRKAIEEASNANHEAVS